MNPKETHHTVSTYLDLTENDINPRMKQRTTNKSNWTYKEQTAMEKLAKRNNLIITNADKSGAVVIMDTGSYIKEANQQLSAKGSYKKLTQDPISQHNKMVNHTIERFKNENYYLKKLQMV